MRCPTLADLPPPPEGKKGWPWTVETSPAPERMPDGKPWLKISIVTPSYNQGQFIEETIRSVLLQGYPDLEYIIMDGGSTDETIEVIRKYEPWITFWASEPDGGQTEAINKGFKRSTGEIVAWLNSDDLYTAGALLIAAKAFAEQPDSAVIYGDADTIDADTALLSHLNSRDFDLRELYRWDYIRQPASFISAKVIQEIGFLDERFHYAMDYDLWIRIGQEKAVMKYIPRKLAWFRMHESSKSVSQQRSFWPEEFLLFDMALRRDASDASLARVAYSHLLRSLVLSHFSQQSYELFSCVNKSTLTYDGKEITYWEPFQEVLRSLGTDHSRSEEDYPLSVALCRLYWAFDNEYNRGESSPSPDIESKWVAEQLILLPNYLLSLGEKTKSVRLYMKFIRMRPSLLRFPQMYLFPVRCFVRADLISKIRGVQ